MNSQTIEETYFKLADMPVICRCCFKNAQTNIYQTLFDNESVASILQRCTSQTLNRGEMLPKNICNVCLKQLLECYHFIVKTRSSESMLRQIVDDVKVKCLGDKGYVEHCYAYTGNLSPDQSVSNGVSLLKSLLTGRNKRVNVASKSVITNTNSLPQFQSSQDDSTTENNVPPVLEIKLDYSKLTQIYIDKKTNKIVSVSTANTLPPIIETLETEGDDAEASDGELPDNGSIDAKPAEEIPPPSPPPPKRQTIEDIMLNEAQLTDSEPTSFKCDICNVIFSNHRILAAHRKKEHSTIPCPMCNKKFIKQYHLELHKRTHTNLCHICDKNFPDAFSLKLHKFKEHPGPYKFPCKVCNKLFKNGHRLKQHQDSHSTEKKYACEVCGKRFTFAFNIKRHMLIHTGEKPFVCDICGKAFNQKVTMDSHRISHTNDNGRRSFMCSECGDLCTTRSGLTYHIRRHHDPTYRCAIPRKSSDGSQANRRPRPTHRTCNVCNQDLPLNSYYDHLLTAHGIGKHVCSYCGKACSNSASLTIHTRTHTGEKPFKCKYCDKRFASDSLASTHEDTHINNRRYKCPKCPKRFIQLSHRTSHMRLHNNIKEFVCPYCQKAFTLKGNLTVHIRLHTGEAPYVCDVCGKGHTNSSSLKKHRQRHFNAGKSFKKYVKDINAEWSFVNEYEDDEDEGNEAAYSLAGPSIAFNS